MTRSGLFTGKNAALGATERSVVSVTRLPCSSTSCDFGAAASKLVTSSGASWTPISLPRVSTIVAHKIFVCFIASRKFASVLVWYAIEPQEKSKRATFMPASRRATSSGTVRDLTPNVQMTFVKEECDTSLDA